MILINEDGSMVNSYIRLNEDGTSEAVTVPYRPAPNSGNIWVDEIKYDFDTIQSAISACKQADLEIHEAQNLLEQVKNHGDWKCKEREIIATEMDKLKKNFQSAVEAHDSLFDAVSKLKNILKGKESTIKNAFDSVEEVIKSILKVPVKEAISTGGGILNLFREKFNSHTVNIDQLPHSKMDYNHMFDNIVLPGVDHMLDPIPVVNFSNIALLGPGSSLADIAKDM